MASRKAPSPCARRLPVSATLYPISPAAPTPPSSPAALACCIVPVHHTLACDHHPSHHPHQPPPLTSATTPRALTAAPCFLACDHPAPITPTTTARARCLTPPVNLTRPRRPRPVPFSYPGVNHQTAPLHPPPDPAPRSPPRTPATPTTAPALTDLPRGRPPPSSGERSPAAGSAAKTSHPCSNPARRSLLFITPTRSHLPHPSALPHQLPNKPKSRQVDKSKSRQIGKHATNHPRRGSPPPVTRPRRPSPYNQPPFLRARPALAAPSSLTPAPRVSFTPHPTLYSPHPPCPPLAAPFSLTPPRSPANAAKRPRPCSTASPATQQPFLLRALPLTPG